MIIKKYQGKTELLAIENAKKELGQNVVVMNVKNLKKKGFSRLFKRQLVEVTVALEEETEQKAMQSPKQTFDLTAKSENSGQKQEKKEDGFNAVISNHTELKMYQNEGARLDNSDKVIEEKLDSLQNFLENQLQKQFLKAPNEESSEETEESEIVRFMKLLYNTMIENEVNEQYANQIIDDLDKVTKPNMTIDAMLSNVYQKMVLKFGQPKGITPAVKGPKVVFFVGPTGVGKTTTIAKIASKFCVEDKKKIALLTADTYRIAAAEQLRTYANILEVPFRVIYSVDEIESAIKEFASYDYIFVDTAGHSHHNESQKDNMNLLIHSVDDMAEIEIYLVVSATTKYRDLLSVANAYTQMANYKIVFTKLDETTTLGNVLNLKLYTGAELSYVTCGQNVPDDIADFNPQSTVKVLLAGHN